MLIEKCGSYFVAIIGAVIFASSSIVLIIGVKEWNYLLGMILCGIAWNFAFSAGTVMLTKSYKVR
jgi:ABC-type Fe3+-siderophore transport system permease subunit